MINDFIQGQRDARAGVEHKAGKSKEYNMGYSFEYQMEQVLSEKSNRNNAGSERAVRP
jgi:hypothetical protein